MVKRKSLQSRRLPKPADMDYTKLTKHGCWVLTADNRISTKLSHSKIDSTITHAVEMGR